MEIVSTGMTSPGGACFRGRLLRNSSVLEATKSLQGGVMLDNTHKGVMVAPMSANCNNAARFTSSSCMARLKITSMALS